MTAEPLWTPDPERARASAMARFGRGIESRHGIALPDYESLHRWSIENPEAFWQEVWDATGVIASERAERVLVDGDRFPGARWFPGARLNFAENLLRHRDDRVALVSLREGGSRRTLTYAELAAEVGRVAAGLRAAGVTAGDRVAGFLPNVPETVVAMLAAASLGAIWSSCSPDFGFQGVMDRFGQITPKVLFVADGYVYGGKRLDSLERAGEIARSLPDLERVVVIPLLSDAPAIEGIPGAVPWEAFREAAPREPLRFEALPFDHPLYILYSSGTTGVPKCIVHGAGGTLLQHLKEHRLHTDLSHDDVFFYFTTCGWMMWNWLVSGLASGATVVLYDGSPMAGEGRVLVDAIDSEGITVFGTSARWLAGIEKAGLRPRETHALGSLRAVLSTGSPLSPESFEYVYRDVKRDVLLASIAGGTDIISCFVLGNPTLPVYRGEIQCRGLGMAVEIRGDDGRPVVERKGELVCTKPFPSCPLGFWKDEDGRRFREAYFDVWPGVWAHGDYGELTGRGGMIIHGRSDAVLNPGGVRIGTAEIYRQVEKVPEVLESIVIGQEWEGDVRIVLFVVLRDGRELDDELRDRIRKTVRSGATPRHVPSRIVQVPAIPRTISGKIVELAVRNVVHGRPVKNVDALANPEALEHFRDLDALRA